MKPCQPNVSMNTHGRRTKCQATNGHITLKRETAKSQLSKRLLPFPYRLRLTNTKIQESYQHSNYRPKMQNTAWYTRHYDKTCLRHPPSWRPKPSRLILRRVEKRLRSRDTKATEEQRQRLPHIATEPETRTTTGDSLQWPSTGETETDLKIVRQIQQLEKPTPPLPLTPQPRLDTGDDHHPSDLSLDLQIEGPKLRWRSRVSTKWL